MCVKTLSDGRKKLWFLVFVGTMWGKNGLRVRQHGGATAVPCRAVPAIVASFIAGGNLFGGVFHATKIHFFSFIVNCCFVSARVIAHVFGFIFRVREFHESMPRASERKERKGSLIGGS